MLYRRLVTLIAFALSFSAQAATRTWHFDLKTPGTYEVHVQHRIGQTKVPLGLALIMEEHTNMKLAREVVKFFLLSTAYWAYITWVSQTVKEESALMVNGFLAPLLIGSIGYLSFSSQNLIRVILAACVTLLAALVASKGGDPAKPGLHLVVIATMTSVSFLGAAATAGAVTVFHSWRNRGKSTNLKQGYPKN